MVTKEASSKIVGFLYQIERALYRIFSNEHDSAVFGIETADDVVEEISFNNGNFHVSFEQDKHSLDASGQPYQDSGKNFWHTLHIWLSTMKDSREKYEKISYCLVTNKSVGENTLANSLSKAQTDEQIKLALGELRKQSNAITGAVKEIAEKVLSYSEDELKFLIKNIILLDNHGTISGLDTKPATISLFHLPSDVKEHAEKIYHSLLGLIVDKCQSSWKIRKPVELTKEPFFNLLYAEINRIKRKNFIDQPILKTSYREYLDKDKASHIFIEQLQYIGKNIESCNNALLNYWAFYAEKVRLQDTGEIPLSAWEDRNDELYHRWMNIKMNSSDPENTHKNKMNKFKKIYSDTMNPDYKASLDGNETSNSYFTIGNYHALANGPERELFVHWHDNYKRIKDK
ncbi:ABC-three component system protein [Pectobacterium actinidiae]|uniref:ABC-three component system protein n=1 Tax=Pectobacterium actinidiae TaxID=1507808 RepID=A0ABW8GAR0_9GAMM